MSDVPGKVRALVWGRADGHCEGCGQVITPGMWWSMQHRIARGQGGGNVASNLLLLCGSATSPGCHRDAEDRGPKPHPVRRGRIHPAAASMTPQDRGLWVSAYAGRPAKVAVVLWDARRVWLTDDGRYGDGPPDWEDAA